MDVVVSVLAYGTIETNKEEAERKVVFWCHQYRRRSSALPTTSAKTDSADHRQKGRALRTTSDGPQDDAWPLWAWSSAAALPLATLALAIGATRAIGALERAMEATVPTIDTRR